MAEEFTIQGDITGLNVSDLRTGILPLLEKGGGLTLQFRDTMVCDSLGMQLLLSVQKSVVSKNLPLTLKGDTGPVRDTANRMGMAIEEYFTIED